MIQKTLTILIIALTASACQLPRQPVPGGGVTDMASKPGEPELFYFGENLSLPVIVTDYEFLGGDAKVQLMITDPVGNFVKNETKGSKVGGYNNFVLDLTRDNVPGIYTVNSRVFKQNGRSKEFAPIYLNFQRR